MTDEIPDWAIERAIPSMDDASYGIGGKWPIKTIKSDAANKIPYAIALIKLARYIAEHEEPPVDPILLEAREICAKDYEMIGYHDTGDSYRNGDYDEFANMRRTLTALRRGIEIGKESK